MIKRIEALNRGIDYRGTKGRDYLAAILLGLVFSALAAAFI